MKEENVMEREEIRKLIEEITEEQKNGNAYKKIPVKFWEEFEDIMDGMRMKYFLLGLQPDKKDIELIKAIHKKVLE